MFEIPKKPQDDKQTFIMVNVKRNGSHEHGNNEKKQIRGVEREEMVKQCLTQNNGSAKAFVNKLIAEQVLAGEELPDDLNDKANKLEAVVRKAVSEYMNREMVSLFPLNLNQSQLVLILQLI